MSYRILPIGLASLLFLIVFQIEGADAPADQATALSSQAAAKWNAGDFDAADALYRQVIELLRKTDNQLAVIHALTNRAMVMRLRGDLKGAEAVLNEANGLSEAHPDTMEHAQVLNHIGLLRQRMKQPGAEALFSQAIAVMTV